MTPNPAESILAGLPLGEVRFYPEIGSTMDAARAWAEEGAPDLSLVLADSQSAGRGRLNRHWVTRPGSALAASLIVRPTEAELPYLTRFSPWGGCGICAALETLGLRPQIKWPNDVLLGGRKTSGILTESTWQPGDLPLVVIGMGINIASGSLPPAGELRFPATCVENELGRPLDRWALLRSLLDWMLTHRADLPGPGFLRFWEERLAFRGELVRLSDGLSPGQVGRVLGLEQDGALRLESPTGELFTAAAGELSLRPADEE